MRADALLAAYAKVGSPYGIEVSDADLDEWAGRHIAEIEKKLAESLEQCDRWAKRCDTLDLALKGKRRLDLPVPHRTRRVDPGPGTVEARVTALEASLRECTTVLFDHLRGARAYERAVALLNDGK